MNMIFHMEGPSDDELAFFLDLAMNECQRWLEVKFSCCIRFSILQLLKLFSNVLFFCFAGFSVLMYHSSFLQVTCRELFIDSDDFVYSLRHGSHLRK